MTGKEKGLDRKDRRILERLQENSRLSTTQLAKLTGIPRVTVHDRIQKLEERGVVTGYSVKVDHRKLGLPITAFILVNVNFDAPFDEVAKSVSRIPGVYAVHGVSGNHDILVKIRAATTEDISALVIDRLRQIKGVERTETMIVLRSTFKEE